MGKAAKSREKAEQYGEAASLLRRVIFLLTVLAGILFLATLPGTTAHGSQAILALTTFNFSMATPRGDVEERFQTASRDYQADPNNLEARNAALLAARYCGDGYLSQKHTLLEDMAVKAIRPGNYKVANAISQEMLFISEARRVFTADNLQSAIDYSSGDEDRLIIGTSDNPPEADEQPAITVASVVVQPTFHPKDNGALNAIGNKLIPLDDLTSEDDTNGVVIIPPKIGLSRRQRKALRRLQNQKRGLPGSTQPLLAPPDYKSARDIQRDEDKRRRPRSPATSSSNGREARGTRRRRSASRSRSPVRRPRTPDGCNMCASTLRLLEQASHRHAQMTGIITRAMGMLKAEAASTSRPPVSLPQEKQRLEHRLSRR
jgi:hypothetical protein